MNPVVLLTSWFWQAATKLTNAMNVRIASGLEGTYRKSIADSSQQSPLLYSYKRVTLDEPASSELSMH